MKTSFAIEKIETEEMTIFFVEGEIDIYSVFDFKKALVESIDTYHTKIVIDFSGISFIDSTGLGVLVSAIKRERAHNGQLVLVITDADIRRIFEITALDRIFSIYLTVDEAVDSFELIEATKEL